MNFLIVNAGCRINGQGGTLSAAMVELAERTLKHHGHCVVVTDLNEPYVVADEVKKILEADVLIFQTPGWWMTTPWQLIKYEDDVFVSPELCGGDGRTRSDPEKKYGSGGFLTNKRYVLSTTWNAPLEAFTDPQQFFEGKGLDGLFMPFHKTTRPLKLISSAGKPTSPSISVKTPEIFSLLHPPTRMHGRQPACGFLFAYKAIT